ncbi:hypothetical protein [Virgibacillus proomii]|jgi:hypothetical protein|uniref:hypothetical protein n=1 Tax=Virgibacillus proomii TaxID=84407 RepID=UPI0009870E70|nr:hypothetical protein [Virgibacillus proomii]
MKNKRFFLFNVVAISSVILAFLFFTIKTTTPAAANNEQIKGPEPNDQTEVKDLSHEEIIKLSHQFINILLQPVDAKYRVENYQTKGDLYQKFNTISYQKVAEPYVEYYYKEKEDGLYLRPTSAPPWFKQDKPYEVVKESDNKVKIKQKNKSDIYGNYTIEIEFTFTDQWRITNIHHS